jgi:hypothetical protein
MNADLRKMAEEAGFERDEWSDFGGNAPVLEAFARLVAEDCAKIADTEASREDWPMSVALEKCGDEIREKYGIT